MQVGSAMKIVHSEESLAAMDDEDKLGYVWIHSADVLSGDEASKVVGATYCHGCSRQALIGVSQAGGGVSGRGTWSSCRRGGAGAARNPACIQFKVDS